MKRKTAERETGVPGRDKFWEDLEDGSSFYWFCVDAAVERLEPKGKAEVPEIIIVSDAVESTFVDLDGKAFRRNRRKSTREGGSGQKELTELK